MMGKFMGMPLMVGTCGVLGDEVMVTESIIPPIALSSIFSLPITNHE